MMGIFHKITTVKNVDKLLNACCCLIKSSSLCVYNCVLIL